MTLAPALFLTCLLAGSTGEADDNSYLCRKSCDPDGCRHCRLEPYVPHEGDIVLFQTNDRKTNIAFKLVHAGPPTHCGIVVRRPDGSLGLLEAPQRRVSVRISDIPCRLQTYDGKVWVRPICTPLTPRESECLTAFACSQVDKPFSPGGSLILPLLKPRKGPVKRAVCGGPNLDPRRWFCSQLVVAAGIVIGRFDPDRVCPLGTSPRDLTEDRQLDIHCCWHKAIPWTCHPCHAVESPCGELRDLNEPLRRERSRESLPLHIEAE